MPAGRPTDYSKETIEKTRQYIDSCEDIEEQQLTGLSLKGTELYKNKLKVNIPTIEGLAFYLKVHKDTIYEWRKVYSEFSDLIGELLAKQARELISKGLSGDYNPTIAKVLLTKHGYREGIEQTGSDGKDLIPTASVKEITEKINEIYRGGSESGDGAEASSMGTEVPSQE